MTETSTMTHAELEQQNADLKEAIDRATADYAKAEPVDKIMVELKAARRDS